MARFSDDDSDRLPEGFVRIGYDADTQVYTYRDTNDGSTWEGAPGCRYGRLTQVSSGPCAAVIMPNDGPDTDDASDATRPFLVQRQQDEEAGKKRAGWRREYTPLLNFFLIIALVLMALIWGLNRGERTYAAASSSASSSSHGTVVANPPADGNAHASACKKNGWEEHVVVAGDTCWDLVKQRGTTVDELLRAGNGNDGVVCESLSVGELICLPCL